MSRCRTKRAHRSVLLPLLLTLVGIPCLLCLCGCPVFMKSRASIRFPISFRRPEIIDEEEQQKQDYPRISHRQLTEATGGFAESSLIGAGSFGNVYKGILRDETRIAVKVLDPKCGSNISGSFKRECEVLKRTRHRNLIRVITACSKPDFKALVLPLMPNGSLESYLHPPDGPSRGLDLNQLVSIISDVAEGIAYLHHYSPVRVVHCDLKPSNVLLDEDMTAIVSDFGIARLVRQDENEDNADFTPYNSITGLLRGSVGYIAPEYGLGGHPSTQGDAYSFGVLILEMITGKRPTDVIFNEGLSLQEWVKSHYPHDLEFITSQAPLRESSLVDSLYYKKLRRDVMVELTELGLACTNLSPTMRPTMMDVAYEISLLKQDLIRHGIEAVESCSTPDSTF